MKIKTSELIGPTLDWAVAKCEGKTLVFFDEYFIRNGIASGKSQGRVNSMLDFQPLRASGAGLIVFGGGVAIYDYSTDWSQGGPIIERERIQVFPHNGASEWCGVIHVPRDGYTGILTQDGPTPLIAAMRAFVTKKFGDEVEIPEVLGDRKDFKINSDEGQEFMWWFEGPGWDWIEKESRRCYGNEDKLHSFDDGKFHIRMNTKASYGYLYITAWMDA